MDTTQVSGFIHCTCTCLKSRCASFQYMYMFSIPLIQCVTTLDWVYYVIIKTK